MEAGSDRANQLYAHLKPLMDAIAQHSLYERIHTLQDLQIFTEHHVFAVWDFMCLLKALSQCLITATVPWFPPKDALGAHLIHEMLAEEEGDLIGERGEHKSHFELYCEGMASIGADTGPIRHLLARLKQGVSVTDALQHLPIPVPAKQFVADTFSLMEGRAHTLASAFVFGREAITGVMFVPMLKSLEENLSCEAQKRLAPLQAYFERHITLDTHTHLPKSLRLLTHLCGENNAYWQGAKEAAVMALQSRLAFLSGIETAIATLQDKVS